MKAIKKLASMLLAVALAVGVCVPAMAFADVTGTVTIDNATAGNTYKIYKVFEAYGNGTNIRYTLVGDKTAAPVGFTVDDAGNVKYVGAGVPVEGASNDLTKLNATDISSIAEYVTEDDLVDTKEATSTTVMFENLPNGYYYITTTTGSAVTVTSANPSVTVKDKNGAPSLDKDITSIDNGSIDSDGQKALAQLGAVVNYTATIEVANGAKNYVFHDVMGTGLTYNNDVKVKIGNQEIAAGETTFTTVADLGDTITLTFVNDWIKDQVGQTITITYSARVNSDALDTNTGKNTATISYGDSNNVASDPDGSTQVYNATLTVTKVTVVDSQELPLAGAGFVLSKTVTEEKEGDSATEETVLYYKYTAATDTEPAKVEWVEDIADATELVTKDGEGGNVVAFTGLSAGSYTLVEKTVPSGYMKAEDRVFTVQEGVYIDENLAQSAKVTNVTGTELPSTGGMGTMIFTAVGLVLIVGAGALLVAKRRSNRG